MKDESKKCRDVRTDCAGLKSYCKTHVEKLEGACDYTCGYCIKFLILPLFALYSFN